MMTVAGREHVHDNLENRLCCGAGLTVLHASGLARAGDDNCAGIKYDDMSELLSIGDWRREWLESKRDRPAGGHIVEVVCL
jgi:hypothetical protein